MEKRCELSVKLMPDCEHRKRHTHCLTNFLRHCGREWDQKSLDTLRRLNRESLEIGRCPLAALHRTLVESRDVCVAKEALRCKNETDEPSECPVHGYEGSTHCSCLDKFIEQKGKKLSSVNVRQLREWLRTRADHRCCAMQQLFSLYQCEFLQNLRFAEEDVEFCQCKIGRCPTSPRQERFHDIRSKKKHKKPPGILEVASVSRETTDNLSQEEKGRVKKKEHDSRSNLFFADECSADATILLRASILEEPVCDKIVMEKRTESEMGQCHVCCVARDVETAFAMKNERDSVLTESSAETAHLTVPGESPPRRSDEWPQAEARRLEPTPLGSVDDKRSTDDAEAAKRATMDGDSTKVEVEVLVVGESEGELTAEPNRESDVPSQKAVERSVSQPLAEEIQASAINEDQNMKKLWEKVEGTFKKFIISLRSKNVGDFKRYYKPAMYNLDAVYRTNTFCNLKLEELIFLLSCDDLRLENEKQVFDMLMHWINFDVARRKEHLFELMRCLRLAYVQKTDVIKMMENPLVAQDVNLRRHALLQGALAFKDYSKENQIDYVKAFKDYITIPTGRGKKDRPSSIVATLRALLHQKGCQCLLNAKFPLTVNITHPFIFLTSEGCIVSSQAYLDVKKETGKRQCIPYPDLNFKENVMVVIGGVCPDYSYGRDAGFNVFGLNPLTLTWDLITRIPARRHHHGVASINGVLYVFGGCDEERAHKCGGNGASKDVFAYDPTGDIWFACPHMSVARAYHTVKVAYGLIYVCGGLDEEDHVLDSVEVFRPSTCSWAAACSMTIGRAGHSCSVHNDELWVLGGFGNSKTNRDERLALRSVEIYNIKDNRWRVGPALRYARCHGVSASVNGKLIIVGGAAWTMQAGRTDACMTSTKDIDVLNEVLQIWFNVGILSVERQEFASLVQGDHMRIFGGISSVDHGTTQSCEILNMRKSTSSPWGPAIPIPVAGAKAAKLEIPLQKLESQKLNQICNIYCQKEYRTNY